MRQVPHYTLIGNGRMAKHLSHYFDLLELSYSQWSRAENNLSSLEEKLNKASHILVLISDNAIVDFIKTHLLPLYADRIILHFSGVLVTEFAISAHPLYSFVNTTLYSKEEYQRIPFITEEQALDFKTLLPGLPNPRYSIPKKDKPYYHALCVLSNNVSSLLWKKFFNDMESKFHISPEHLKPFLKRTFDNIKFNPDTALTGPVARGDIDTLNKNHKALDNDPYQDIIKAIIDNFTEEKH